MSQYKYLLPITVALLFSGSFIVGRVSTNLYEPLSVAVLRNCFALAFLFTLPKQSRGQTFSNPSLFSAVLILASGIFGIAGYLYCFLRAITITSAPNAAVINSFIPAMTAIFGIFMLNERYVTRVYIGFAIATVGVIILIIGSNSNSLRFELGTGELWMFLAVICSGLHATCTKLLSSVYPSQLVTRLSIIVGLLVLIPLAVFVGNIRDIGSISQNGWLGIIYMGVGASGLGGLMYTICIRELGATLTAGYVYAFVPIFVTILSMYCDDSSLTTMTVTSYSLVLFGLALTLGSTNRLVTELRSPQHV
jgi:drug/metabolite transporter (DMT)-like permease